MPKHPWLCGVLALMAGLGFASPRESSAQTGPAQAEFRVVVEVRGPTAWGRRPLSRRLRRTLADGIGGLRSSRAFRRAQRRLKIPKKRQTYPSRLARTAREIKADYVLFVRIERLKARERAKLGADSDAKFVAKAYLITAKDGKIAKQASFPFAAKTDAAQVGNTIAVDMTAALRATRAPPPPVAVKAPEPAVEAPEPSVPDPTAPWRTEPPPPPAPPPTATPSPLPPLPDRLQPPVRRTVVTAPDAAPTRTFRFGLGLGSALFRDYALSSDAGDSALSYDLPPVFLVGLDLEFDVPGTGGTERTDAPDESNDSSLAGLTLAVRAAFRTMAFEVNTDGEAAEPGGTHFDGRFLIDYGFALADTFTLRPQVGLRLGLTSVGEHASAAILSSTMLAPIVGVRGELGRRGGIEGHLGVDAGYVVFYDESPTQTGDSPGGLALGVDLSGRFWLDDRWAITADGRFSYDQVSFSGLPTRGVLRTEAPAFRSASIATTDASVRVGVMVSL